MKKRLLLLFLLATPFLGTASHIVGGEFELVHIKDFQYRLNLVLYFDVINGQPGAKDPSAPVRIFRKIDGARMMEITLPLTEEKNVDYTQPECSHGELVTRRLFYTAIITLSPDVFIDPGGYYVAWERCCRNYNITNIFSDNPAGSANFAGQTFYLEFPPVMKDGQPFIDSTPRLFPPLNDFGCPRRPYYTDFGGTDDDGDSLYYSLVTPLNTKSADALAPGGTRPGPYPDVRWRPPYGPTNVMNGKPDLHVSKDGFLTVTPSQQGLYVFAVKVEEFRNKVKIGETRRDFQMLVVDACPKAVAPQILGKTTGQTAFTFDNKMSITFPNTITDIQRCVQVQVSDLDSKSLDDNLQEKIKIKALALNFKKDLSGILPSVTSATLINGSTAEFSICFPQCPFFTGGAAEIGIIVMDDACSLPLTDTLKISVFVEPPVNHPPKFTSTNPVTAALPEGSQTSWPWKVVDEDNDKLIITAVTNGFVLKDAGMTFSTQSIQTGSTSGELLWDAFCTIYDFTKRTSFQVTIVAEDQDLCLLPNAAKAIYNLSVILPGNADPIIDTDLTTNPYERTVKGLTRRITESLNFSITGQDLVDRDLVVMTGTGKDFKFEDYGITLDANPVSGRASVNSNLKWDLKCGTVDLKKKDTFGFQFIVVDNANLCRQYKADTVDVEVKILPPLNQAPLLSITNNNPTATVLYNSNINMTLGPAIELILTGTDSDLIPSKDNVKIELIKQSGNVDPEGFSFSPVTGKSPIQTSFVWQPDCSIFQEGIYENDYSFTFRISDDHCITAKRDSVTIKIKVKDVDGTDANFMPPNFFSPNSDNINDYFAMELKDPVTSEIKNILPLDNCVSVFEGIRIYNRWGNQVFQSRDRNFKWFAHGESAGVYYYFINYTKKEYKGSISLRY